jgi:hypothetical protein
MRKETILTAVVFLVVGFLAGYITDAQLNWSGRQKAAVAGAATPAEMPGGAGSSSAAAAGMSTSGLPPGHPPIDASLVTQQLESLARQSPKDPEAALKLANYLYDQHQYGKSIEWYQRVLALDPKNVNARTDMGTAYFYTGHPRDALEQYQQSLKVDPRHEATLLNMIVVNLDGTHDLAAAQAAWERLRKVNPNNPQLESLKERLDAARGLGSGAATQN